MNWSRRKGRSRPELIPFRLLISPLVLALTFTSLLFGCAKRVPPPWPEPIANAPAPVREREVEEEPVAEPPKSQDEPEAPTVFANPGRLLEPPADPITGSPAARRSEIEERIDWWLNFWRTRSQGPIQRSLRRMGRYQELVDTALEARGLPSSLRYLPIIEAAYYTKALSHVGAGGLWQFMPETARWMGLEVNSIIDERFDPEKATPLALDYLARLHNQFDSWFLALAAYNSGPGRVERVLREHAEDESMSDETFWRIREHLPPETRDFIPKYLAAARLAEDPERYGFADEREPPITFDEVTVTGAASIDVIAEAAGTTEEEMADLNPQLVKGLTPAGRTTKIKLPAGLGAAFPARFARIPENQRVTFVEHRVAAGETLSHIALQYRVSVSALRDANPNVDPRLMQIGTVLVIPR